jgi:hypothetical protein
MRVAAALLVSVVGFAACNEATGPTAVPAQNSEQSPPAPAPPRTGPPPIPTGSYSVTGLVTERTPQGVQPVSGANVNAWVQTGTLGYSFMFAHGPRLTDASGRYQLGNLPAGATFQLQVYKDSYVQQCATPQLVINADVTQDAGLVARANVSSSPDSAPPSAPGQRWIAGIVYEVLSDGRRPVGGAFVDYEPFMDSPAAITYTDPQGRFLLCGIPQVGTSLIGTSIGPNRYAYQNVPAGPNTTIELEIR